MALILPISLSLSLPLSVRVCACICAYMCARASYAERLLVLYARESESIKVRPCRRRYWVTFSCATIRTHGVQYLHTASILAYALFLPRLCLGSINGNCKYGMARLTPRLACPACLDSPTLPLRPPPTEILLCPGLVRSFHLNVCCFTPPPNIPTQCYVKL